MIAWLSILAAGWAGCGLTAWARREALRLSMYDVANHRSMHQRPTPRGGGLAIVGLAIAASILGSLLGWIDGALGMALGVGAASVGGIGWIDDRFDVSARLRLVVHLAASALATYLLWPDLPWWAGPAVVLLLTWSINLFNFMDGIDGYAGSEAACVFGYTALTAGWLGAFELAWTAGVLAAASFGFLRWNWPPARIFMGDVGSGFCGLAVGVCALRAYQVQPAFGWGVAAAYSGFWMDATLTLATRMITRQPWYAPHRLHAYQKAARALGRHAPVTWALVITNLIVLAPACFACALGILPIWGLAVWLAPLGLFLGAWSPGVQET